MKYRGNIIDVLRAVTAEYGIPASVVCSSVIRTKPVVKARHIAMYLATEHTYLSKRQLALSFNVCDHSTIIHGANKIRNSTDPDVIEVVNRLKAKLVK